LAAQVSPRQAFRRFREAWAGLLRI
jgi:hypothetical protein